jgi:N-acylneuraminate cytidylyltransferase
MAIAFIPVRCGSRSIPWKNIKDLCGKPLLYWSVKAASGSKNIDRIVVATDCREIADVVSSFSIDNVEVYMRQPVNARDISSTESVMIEYISNKNLPDNEIFILIQATNPTFSNEDIDKALRLLNENKADSLLSCARVKRFLWNKDGYPLNYEYMERPRRQEFEGSLMENGAFYINTVGNILKYGNRLSGNILVYEMPEYTSVELDEPDDWIIAEHIMRKHVLGANQFSLLADIKLFLMDVDGVLTDAGMYYSENGDELKKFNTHDGKGIELIHEKGIKVGIITSENTNIVSNRARKLNIDYLYQGVKNKLEIAEKICLLESISLNNVAYVGDDINDLDLLSKVGIAACPANSLPSVKNTPGIIFLENAGGEGAVREFCELLIKKSNQNYEIYGNE